MPPPPFRRRLTAVSCLHSGLPAEVSCRRCQRHSQRFLPQGAGTLLLVDAADSVDVDVASVIADDAAVDDVDAGGGGFGAVASDVDSGWPVGEERATQEPL